MAADVVIKDFNYDDTPIPFTISGETFYIYADLPLGLIDDVAKMQETGVANSVREHGLSVVYTLLESFLIDESYTRFMAKVNAKKFGVRLIMDMLPWILEQYGLRPTQPSEPSLDGSADGETGISSMDGAQLEESIL